MFYFTVVQMCLWWFFHILIMFWGIKFPFHAKSFADSGRMKYVHIAMVLIALTVPFAGVGSIFKTLSLTLYPAFFICMPGSDERFYSLSLPVSVLIAGGLSLLVIIFLEFITVRARSMSWTSVPIKCRDCITGIFFILSLQLHRIEKSCKGPLH